MWKNIFSPEKKRRDGDQAPPPAEKPAAAAIEAKPPAAAEPKPDTAKSSPHQPRAASSEGASAGDHRGGHGADHASEEYERRMKVLSVCLEEKAEENIELYKKLQAQQELVHKRDATIRDLQAAMEASQEQQRILNEKLEAHATAAKHQEALVSEFTRRTQVLSMCLDDMAQENIALTTKLASLQGLSREELERKLQHFQKPVDQHVDDKERKTAPAASASSSSSGSSSNMMTPEERLLQDYFDVISAVKEERARDLLQRFQRALALESDNHKKANAHLQQSEEELTQLKASVAALEKQVKQLTSKLLKEKDAKASFQESCDKYEKKMRKLEVKAKENLQKEGKRRQEAEYVASKLKKKVSELTFLLKEKADTSSDEEPAAPAEPSVSVIRASFSQPSDTPRPSEPAPSVAPSPDTPAPSPPPSPAPEAAGRSVPVVATAPASPPKVPQSFALVAEEEEHVVSVTPAAPGPRT